MKSLSFQYYSFHRFTHKLINQITVQQYGKYTQKPRLPFAQQPYGLHGSEDSKPKAVLVEVSAGINAEVFPTKKYTFLTINNESIYGSFIFNCCLNQRLASYNCFGLVWFYCSACSNTFYQFLVVFTLFVVMNNTQYTFWFAPLKTKTLSSSVALHDEVFGCTLEVSEG